MTRDKEAIYDSWKAIPRGAESSDPPGVARKD